MCSSDLDVVFQPEDQELTIETLGYPDTYFVKWFMHVCCQEQQGLEIIRSCDEILMILGFDPILSKILFLVDHQQWGFSKHFLLIRRIPVSKWGLRPNIKVQVFAPHIFFHVLC